MYLMLHRKFRIMLKLPKMLSNYLLEHFFHKTMNVFNCTCIKYVFLIITVLTHKFPFLLPNV